MMTHYLNTSKPTFPKAFAAFLNLREQQEQNVAPVVEGIIARVRKEGDAALIALTEQFDGIALTPKTLRFSSSDIAKARKACGKDIVKALEHAAKRIADYHKRQLPKNTLYKDKHGNTLGWRWNAIDAAGLYVPGGTASYPSAVLMNAIPAHIAGVKRIAMVVPTPKGIINPAVLVAAEIAGVSEIYRVGGAQAVAALAYGTKTIVPVDKIFGPGNAYVAEAKRQVFGKVGIDMIAGPSEILVVADNKNNPDWIAADLLSQAEHGSDSQAVLITNDAAFAAKVEQAIEKILRTLSREAIARKSWEIYGAIILVKDWKAAPPIIDAIAPEHLELAIDKPEAFAKQVRHAGAIFLGRHSPEAVGDYIAGPSHVLPTSHSARFSSGLGVYDFLKRTSLIGCTQAGVRAIGADAAIFADAEGLPAHALSLRLRL
jgi:histidinol dehydrogenase